MVTAEGGPVEIGAHCVIMENAVVRGVPQHPARLGDHVLVGPHASLTGCVVEGDTRIATGAVVVNGARIGRGAELEFHSDCQAPGPPPAHRRTGASQLRGHRLVVVPIGAGQHDPRRSSSVTINSAFGRPVLAIGTPDNL